MKPLALILLLCLCGCGEPPTDDKRAHELTRLTDACFVVEIDGCQYVIYHDTQYISGGITHKGNCTNPIHKDSRR
jgi:hypothetical protein